MPQTDCYLCEADVLEIADLLFHQGARIVPDLHYPTSPVSEISDLRGLQRILDDSSSYLLFVVSPKWKRSQLVTRCIVKEGREVYYVSQKEGGPTLDIFYLRAREVDGTLAIPAGFISYHDRFWNPLTRQMESPPRALIDTYRAIRSQLARGGRFVVRKHRKLIVTRNTQSSGLKLIDLKRHAQDKPRTIDPTKSLGREEIKNESDKLR